MSGNKAIAQRASEFIKRLSEKYDVSYKTVYNYKSGYKGVKAVEKSETEKWKKKQLYRAMAECVDLPEKDVKEMNREELVSVKIYYMNRIRKDLDRIEYIDKKISERECHER